MPNPPVGGSDGPSKEDERPLDEGDKGPLEEDVADVDVNDSVQARVRHLAMSLSGHSACIEKRPARDACYVFRASFSHFPLPFKSSQVEKIAR